MNTHKKPLGQEGLVKNQPRVLKQRDNTTTNKASTKFERILTHLLAGNSLHRFSAEAIGDHALPSTISTFSNLHGIKFDRDWIEVPNRFGSTTRVMSYRLAVSSIPDARKYLGLEAVV